MNEELGAELAAEIGGGKTKFFEANVLETDSIASAVKGALAWVKETGKEVGGVIAAAGVSNPAKASHNDITRPCKRQANMCHRSLIVMAIHSHLTTSILS